MKKLFLKLLQYWEKNTSVEVSINKVEYWEYCVNNAIF